MSNLFSESEIITTDNFLSFCVDNKICYAKSDYFYTWGYENFLKTSSSPFFWRNEYHPKKLEKFCVLGHSDFSITDKEMLYFDKVFCVNKNNINPNCFPIPLGICNFTDEHEKMPIYGDKKIMFEVMKETYEKTVLAYINFDDNTNHSIRKKLRIDFSNKDWTLSKTPDNSIFGRKNYLIDIKKSKFVFCPIGNGVDTHRLWETLYLGSIPIVINHPTHELLFDLPILFIESWEIVNENLLRETFEHFQNRKFNLQKLKQSYWNNLIKNEFEKYQEVGRV